MFELIVKTVIDTDSVTQITQIDTLNRIAKPLLLMLQNVQNRYLNCFVLFLKVSNAVADQFTTLTTINRTYAKETSISIA